MPALIQLKLTQENKLIHTILTQNYAPFVYKLPPYYLHEFAGEVYLHVSPIYASLGLCDSDEREEG